ncbi:uncharacterized protein LOC128226192 [Mya arenaria]|uniref:uncharacterized protein LOC128226192 n=1 Tax=Mya arenaria TaxID=6604 RepID=UPI0022DEC3F1|nr:uncharacterized protein LOC128226192 [Mya arenaria]
MAASWTCMFLCTLIHVCFGGKSSAQVSEIISSLDDDIIHELEQRLFVRLLERMEREERIACLKTIYLLEKNRLLENRLLDVEIRLALAEEKLGRLDDSVFETSNSVADGVFQDKNQTVLSTIDDGIINRTKKQNVPIRRITASGGSSNHVAFSAQLSTDTLELGLHHMIPFDVAITNEGGAFDTTLSVFTCPVNGIYTFMCAQTSLRNDYIQLEIVINGNSVAEMYAAGATSGSGHGYDQGFNSVIRRCNTGDRVWVRVHNHDGTALNRYGSSFSGFLNWIL